MLLILALLTACGTTPAETTVPTTAPVVANPVETTVPPTTEPHAPEGFVCLNEMFKGSDITITVEGPDIILEEDGLVLNMSTEHKDVYRNYCFVGVMKECPVVEGKYVYIHDQFFDYFFCKEGTDKVSLFHGTWFEGYEVLNAVENPDASAFNTKVCAEVLLPQSMGVTVPHIDENRIFLAIPLQNAHYSELVNYGYTRQDILLEAYRVIRAGQTLKAAGISEDDYMTVGEYMRKDEKQRFQEFLNNELTEEERVFLEQKGIAPTDYEVLIAAFPDGSILSATDEELIRVIEKDYGESLKYVGSRFYEKYFSMEHAELSAMVINFENMSQRDRMDWFFEFARVFRVDYIPNPSTDALDYLDWIWSFTTDDRGFDKLERAFVEEIVRTYFGVTPNQFHTLEYHWIFDEETQTYSGYPAGSLTPVSDIFFLLNSIDYEDGLYTIHATQYRSPVMYTAPVMEVHLKNDLFDGNDATLISKRNMSISFRLDPETNLPIFCGKESESLTD